MLDGDRAWTEATTIGLDELDGRQRQQEILGAVPVLLGDWAEYYEHVEVLRRVVDDGQKFVLVRVAPADGPGSTMFVNEATGLVTRRDDLVQIPGVRIVGVRTVFEDYRDVEGLQIAFRIRSTAHLAPQA